MTALATDLQLWAGPSTDQLANEAMIRQLELDSPRPVGLGKLMERAALMERTDRKYIAPVGVAQELVNAIGDTHRVLAIKGRRYTTYRTLYFDTVDLRSARAHVQGRRQRWKVRMRHYLEDDLCRVEVKTKDNRGSTVKVMGESDPSRFGALTGRDRKFVALHLSDFADVRAQDLVPTAEVLYTRATMTDLAAGTRATFDWGLTVRMDGGHTWLDDQFVMVETKGPAALSRVDRTLHDLGVRPRGFSKYVSAASATRSDIPFNDFASLRAKEILHVSTV